MHGIKIFSMMLVCSFFFLACEDQGDPVTSTPPPSNSPTINSVSPDSGAAGDTVTITGANFGNVQGTSTVSFGTISAAVIVSWSNTQIVVVVPANVISANVTVTVGSNTSNTVQFKVIGSAATVSFATDILQNIFNKSSYGCTGCHGGTNNLFLNSYANVMAGNSTRGPVVVPGDTSSLLIRKLKGGTFLGANDGARMPQGGAPIAESDLRNMVTWIKEGALNN